MNRAKKEENRREAETLKGISQAQSGQYFADKAREDEISTLAHKIHIELFPEEYDHMTDSYVDTKDRANGINPMSEGYIQRRDKLRKQLGFAPYDEEPEALSTRQWVKNEIIAGRKEHLLEIIRSKSEIN